MSAPCRACGVATDRDLQPSTLPASPMPGSPHYEVGTCADCASLRPDEPGAAVRAALRLLGRPEGDWALAADAFEEAGLDVAYLLHASRPRREPGRRPWGHVEKEQRAALRKAYVAVLDRRVHAATAKGRPVPEGAPPPLRSGEAVARDPRTGRRRVVGGVEQVRGPAACLVCGVARSASWRRVSTRALTPGPDFVEGHICAECSEVHDVVDSLGPTLVERAALAHAGVEWSEQMSAPGLRAWVALHEREGMPPQAEPWAWVGEFRLPEPEPTLADLAAQVAALTAAVARLEARS